MEINTFAQMISTVGFPIACTIAMGIFIWKAYQAINQNNQNREERLYDIITETQKQLDKAQDNNQQIAKSLKEIQADLATLKER